jgi:hypothetical protein
MRNIAAAATSALSRLVARVLDCAEKKSSIRQGRGLRHRTEYSPRHYGICWINMRPARPSCDLARQ